MSSVPVLPRPAAVRPAAPRPIALKLPIEQHSKRLPPHLSVEQVERIRLAARQLPQVVTALDYGAASAAAGEDELDRRGLVLLQRGGSGAGPGRWIAPDTMDMALAHLDAVGTQPVARTWLAERTRTLQSLGVWREADGYTRVIRQTLVCAGTSVPVAYRMAVDEHAVWAFHRTGDEAALQVALGPVPAYPHAQDLVAHLNALIARSRSGHPRQVDSLLPRLLSECATPQPWASLRDSCTRAQDRWEHQAGELDTLAGLTSELAFQGYPDTFEAARRLQRSVTLYVGPPNSGKTHAAFERLAQVDHGAYLAPLRLLALEGRDRLVARGVNCSLLTGEENVPVAHARVVSSTIEMVDTRVPMDLAVIDEAQMIFDQSRGWAWTQAIVAVPANEVIIICSAHAVAAIEALLGLCGERCVVRRFDRMQHVQWIEQPVALRDLRHGDAVVAFSRRDVLKLRDQIAAQGHPVSVIYGALPPEVRRREAERYAQGDSHILVATDAIGMGLNLPIRRVLFSTLTKYDGTADRPLSDSEVHQIAGRAGRYGIHEEGHVGVLQGAEPTAPRVLQQLLLQTPQAPREFKAPVAPNAWHVQTIASRLGKSRLRDVLDVFVDQLKLDDAHFAVAELDAMLELAEQLDLSAPALTLGQRFIYAQAPVDTRTDTQVQQFLEWSSRHALTGRAGTPWFLDEVNEHSRLERMEQALRACTLWLWLDLRFAGVYGHLEAVTQLRSRLNDGIERQLKGKRPLAQPPRTSRR